MSFQSAEYPTCLFSEARYLGIENNYIQPLYILGIPKNWLDWDASHFVNGKVCVLNYTLCNGNFNHSHGDVSINELDKFDSFEFWYINKYDLSDSINVSHEQVAKLMNEEISFLDSLKDDDIAVSEFEDML